MDLLVRGLAIWRISSLLVREDGPNQVLRKLRERTGITYWSTTSDGIQSYPAWNPLVCIYCTSVWVALCSLVIPRQVLILFAGSALAIVLDDSRTKWL
jgi:hypothetical protein